MGIGPHSNLFLFLAVNQTSREALNAFVPNSQGKHVCSLARTNLNVKVKVKGQGDQAKRAVHSYHPRQRYNGTRSLQIAFCSSRRDHFRAAEGDFLGLRAAYVS